MTSSAAALARRTRRSLLTRRIAEAGAAAGSAGLAVGLMARLEGWAAPAAAAAAAALAMLAAFWASARSQGGAVAALDPDADEDALLRAALASSAGTEWRELLARASAERAPRHRAVGEWVPAALLAAAALFALAWQDSRPTYAPPPSPAGPAIAPGAGAPASQAQFPRDEAAAAAPRDGGSAGAQGEWRALDPAAAEGSILLPPGAAARERGAIERYLRHRAEAAE